MPFDIPALQRAANFQPTQNTDLARYILTHANVDWGKAANLTPPKQKKPGSPSVLSRILDVLSRPSYAVDEMARRFIQHEATNNGQPVNPEKHKQDFLHEIGDILHGGASGLAGTQKTTWAKTFTELNPKSSPVARYGGGFLLDLLTDPTTYVGPGIAKSVIRGARSLYTGGKAAKEVIPESKGIVSVVRAIPKVPSASRDAQRLPEGLSRASGQVRTPVFHAPGMAVDPRMSVPKVAIPNTIFPKLHSKPPAGTGLLSPQEIEAFASADVIKATSALERVYRAKGLKDTEHTAAGIRDKIYEEGEKIVPEQKRDWTAQKLADLLQEAKEASPFSRTTPKFEHAGQIVDKLAQGAGPKLAKPIVDVTVSPQTRYWAERTAKSFESNVLSKSNKFAKTAGKAPAVNNPAQQANLFLRYANNIAPKLIKGAKYPNSKKFINKRYTDAYRMMKVAEDYYRSKGLHPTFWDGSRVALTDVIDELGGPTKVSQEHMTQLITAFKNKNPDKIVSPEIRQAIENVRARDAMVSAKWVRLALDQNSQQAKVAEQVLSHGKYKDFVDNLISKNKQIMQMTDVSPVGIKSTQHLLREVLTRNGTLPQMATDAKKTYIQFYVTPGSKKVKWFPVQAAQTKALSAILGSSPVQLGKQLSANGQSENWFLSRFASWYGQKDLRPEVLNATAGALNSAAARAKIWNQVAKDYNPEEINEAFKIAQGHILSPSSQRTTDLGMQFQRAMENLFSSTGITAEAQKAASVAMRSGALIKDLNEQLGLVKSGFKFTQAKEVKDFMGRTHNYSKGVDWLKSWEVHEAKDPLDFIMRVESATEQLMHKYAYLDEVAARWGSKIKSNMFSTPVAGRTKLTKDITVGRLDGVYFHKDLATQLERSLDTWHQIYDPKSPLIRFLDRVTRAWKTGVTVYAPSHHIRNFIGDVYLSWLAGVNNPRSYSVAKRILFSQKDRYKSLETISDLTDKNAVRQSLTRPGEKVLTTRGGVDLTAEQIYIAAHSKGLLSHVNIIEDLIGDPLIKAQPLNGWLKEKVHAASELREHYVRLAHFADILKKSKEKDLPRLFSQAAQEVRKWHPDGMDLTKFEREKMKRIFPFYSWTRKTIPLLVEGAVQHPGKILAYPRGMYALQGSLGIESSGPTDPFPEDQLFPDWIKAKGIGPIMGGPGDYTIVNPSNPFNDVVSQYFGTGKPRDIISGVGSSLNPVGRVPAELLTGQTVLGQPVDRDLNRYATEQIPIASLMSRLFNMGVAGPTDKAQKQGNLNDASLINFLTALGIQPTKPYINQAQYEQRGK